MTESERIKLGEERKLLFQNFCNGVPLEDLMTAFKRSRLEVEKDIAFVAKRIQFSRHKGLTGLGPILKRIEAEMARRDKDEGTLADLKAKASVLRTTAGVPIECDLLTDIRRNHVELLMAVRKLGPLFLSSDILIPRVNVQKLEGPGDFDDINQRVKAR